MTNQGDKTAQELNTGPAGIVRFQTGDASRPIVGVTDGAFVRELKVASLGELMRLSLPEIEDLARADYGRQRPLSSVRLLPPLDGTSEVWAAGVTYRSSQLGRIQESASADIYERIYDAERPELFFKAAGWRVVTDGEEISVRPDSEINVPEPELALVISSGAEIVGLLVCNDVSSRSLEGENPLYLPQAKTYLGSCSLSNVIRPIWQIRDPYELDIHLTVERSGAVIWNGTASTSEIRRRFPELVEHLFRCDIFPDGVILATGTSLVPQLPFSLVEGDIVAIDISEVGAVRNRVVRGFPYRHRGFERVPKQPI